MSVSIAFVALCLIAVSVSGQNSGSGDSSSSSSWSQSNNGDSRWGQRRTDSMSNSDSMMMGMQGMRGMGMGRWSKHNQQCSGQTTLTSNSGVRGTLTFNQTMDSRNVTIRGTISGLTPGQHGFHIHEIGDTGNNCMAAGEHFNPMNMSHSGPNSRQRHIGDLGNIVANQAGVATVNISDSRIMLKGPMSIIGRTIVVHAQPDDLGNGGNSESLTTGNAGGRVACGVIGMGPMPPMDMNSMSSMRMRGNMGSMGSMSSMNNNQNNQF